MTSRDRRTTGRIAGVAAMLVCGLFGAGCSGLFAGDDALIESLDEQRVRMPLEVAEAAYAVHPSEASLLFSSVPFDRFAETSEADGLEAFVLHAQLLWVPKPGTTPIDPTATNVTLRWIVFAGGEVGVYGGAGFCWPDGEIGKDALTLDIEASTLSLIASTSGFVDQASPASISGRFRAAYRPAAALELRQRVSRRVTEAVGRAYWVDGGPVSSPIAPRGEMSVDSMWASTASITGAVGHRGRDRVTTSSDRPNGRNRSTADSSHGAVSSTTSDPP